MIVKEHRMLLKVDDITHVRLTCDTCGTAISTQMDGDASPVTRCPSCRSRWIDDYPDRRNPEMLLLEALRMVRNAPSSGFDLELETGSE